jgi:hypothetical protein
MRKMTSWRRPIQLILWVFPLFFAVLACNLELPELRIGQNEPTETNLVVDTLTPGSAITPTPGDSGAACLPGTWQVDHESVIEYMRDTMAGVGETAYTPLSSEGKLELQIESREITLVAEDFKINVGVKVGGDPDAASNETSVQADVRANFLASGTQINLTDISYNIEGTLNSDNRLYNMELEDLLVMANTYGFARDLSLPVESTFFSYTCSGDTLSIVVNDFASVSFNREQ